MSKAVFPETTGNESQKPQDGGTRSASDIRNALSALFQGDFAPLRARAQDTPDMTVKVNAAVIQGYFAQVNASGQPVSFSGGNSSAVSAPSSNPRIDILYLNPSTSSLGWVTGTESASPAADWSGLPEGAIPICLVYCKTTMTKIVNYEDKDANPNDGYIYQDVRPVIGGGGGADEKVKADNNDPTPGYLDAKVDNSTIEVDASSHKIRVKDGGINGAKIASSAISQAKLKTATGEVSDTSGKQVLILPGGEYGFYPRVKGTNKSIVTFAGGNDYTSSLPSSYKPIIQSKYATFYASQRYITSSGKDHWIFLLVAKKDILDKKGNLRRKKGSLIASYQAPDHPATNNGADLTAIPHPFGSYDPEKHEIVIVDNGILYEAKKRITRKRGLLEVINEDFIIDDWQRPKFEPREIILIDEFGDLEGEEIKRMKTPQWAKIMIQPEEISLKRKIVEQLPDFILYKKMRLKR